MGPQRYLNRTSQQGLLQSGRPCPQKVPLQEAAWEQSPTPLLGSAGLIHESTINCWVGALLLDIGWLLTGVMGATIIQPHVPHHPKGNPGPSTSQAFQQVVCL